MGQILSIRKQQMPELTITMFTREGPTGSQAARFNGSFCTGNCANLDTYLHNSLNAVGLEKYWASDVFFSLKKSISAQGPETKTDIQPVQTLFESKFGEAL
jgi:hypothetical protein